MAGTEVATGAPVQTLRPHPVTTEDTGVFDTSQGTVHLVLGCGGTNANLDDYGVDTADGHAPGQGVHQAEPAHPRRGTPGTFTRAAADAVEDAPWSAKRDTSTGYGIAVFDVDPGVPGGHDQHHGHAVPRAGRGPGQPDHRRGRAPPRPITPSSRRSPWSGPAPTGTAATPSSTQRPWPDRVRPGDWRICPVRFMIWVNGRTGCG